MAAVTAADRPWRPVALIAYVLAATMIGTTLPTSLYPTYERVFMFGQVTETVVFAIYALGVLVTLILLGQVSDMVGRRPVLLAAVSCATISSVIFLISNSVEGSYGVALLLVARLFSGASAGLVAGTATAALADNVPSGRGQLAGLIAATAQVIGLGLGPLIGGVLLKNAPHPLEAVYIVYLVLLAIAAVAIALIPETIQRMRGANLVTPLPFSAIMGQANSTGLIGFAGFAVLGLFTGVSAAILALAGHHDPVTTGLVVFSVFAASAVGQLVTARLAPRPALLAGTALLAVGAVIVGLSLKNTSVTLLEVGGLIAGIGVGMSFRAALAVVAASATPSHRSEAASSFFVICYLGISLPIVGVGIASRAYGLRSAGQVFAFLIAAIAVGLFAMLTRKKI